MSTTKLLRGTLNASPGSLSVSSLTNYSLAVSSAYTPTDTRYVLCEVEGIFLATGLSGAPAASTGLSIWFLREVDGTNYEDYKDTGTATAPLARMPDVVLPLRAYDEDQRIVRVAMMPPGSFKVLVKNDSTGVTISATISIRPFTYQQA